MNAVGDGFEVEKGREGGLNGKRGHIYTERTVKVSAIWSFRVVVLY